MDKMINLLKEKPIYIPTSLFYNYKKLNITEEELIILMFLINTDEIFNPMLISSSLQIDLNKVMQIINNLITKNIIEIETVKEKQIKEIIKLNKLYEKLALTLKNETKKDNTDIYTVFEKELGRTLAPSEVAVIAEFKEMYNEDLIIAALKNAIIMGARNLRYIDSTLKNWASEGIKTKEELESKKSKKEKERKPEIIDYDWLNES